jgi:putative flippase GtrA
MATRTSPVEFAELARFVITGVTATLGNLSVVWLTRHVLPYETAIIPGVATGFVISFLMSKLFAFRSRSWSGSGGEAIRFMVVYLIGSLCYWLIAVLVERVLSAQGVAQKIAESAGVLGGAGTMMVTSYFGHRFFTYRTFGRPTDC